MTIADLSIRFSRYFPFPLNSSPVGLPARSKIFEMSIQRDPYNWSGKLYEKYCLEMGNYTRENVVRALGAARQRNEIAFLREWPTRFENHRLVEKGMADMFIYLVQHALVFVVPANEFPFAFVRSLDCAIFV
jgi:hypothetical protein